MTLFIYQVTVRNQITGEIAMIEWESDCRERAQVDVLRLLFRSRGWRKAVAMVPEVVVLESEAA